MYLAICAVVKNEFFYLREWIEFGLLQGVEQFFITDNGSTDGTLDILEEYARKGLVTYTSDERSPIQFVAYNFWLGCFKDSQDPPHWVAFLDADEYLHSPGGARVADILPNYEDAAAVAVHWVLYGSKESEGSLVTERFQHRAKEVNQHTKVIVKPSKTSEVGKNPHYFLVDGKTTDENGDVLRNFYGLKKEGTADILRIAHFHIKSWPEYLERKSTKPDPGTNRFIQDIKGTFDAHDVNEMFDPSAACWAEAVKKSIEERK